MRSFILFFASYVWWCNGQLAPHWGKLKCGDTITDRFLAGEEYSGYSRYYTIDTTPQHLDTSKFFFPVDVIISTCIPHTHDTINAQSEEYLYWTESPEDEEVRYDTNKDCKGGEQGLIRKFSHIAQSNWDIGIFTNSDNGGQYRLSVTCTRPSYDLPEPNDYNYWNATVIRNYVEQNPGIIDTRSDWFEWREWRKFGSKTISCGQTAYGTFWTKPGKDFDLYQYELFEPTNVAFTTCKLDAEWPLDYFQDNKAVPNERQGEYVQNAFTFSYYSSSTFDPLVGTDWRVDTFSTSTSRGCVYYEVGTSDFFASPGLYLFAITFGGGGINGNNYDGEPYAITMLCLDDDAVATATDGTDFNSPTQSPTRSPLPGSSTYEPTGAPTTATPTQSDPPTSDPTMFPSEQPTPSPVGGTDTPTTSPTSFPTNFPTSPPVKFEGWRGLPRKAMEKGRLSCNIWAHDKLQRLPGVSHWYVFALNETLEWWAFDVCKDDRTKFDSGLALYRLNWNNEWIWENDADSSGNNYCNYMNSDDGSNPTLTAGIWAIEIYDIDEDEPQYGEYILRMNCLEIEEYKSLPVDETKAPTPSPVGLRPFPFKDGDKENSISCDVTVEGEISKSSGDFHRFEVKRGGIEWVKFDTCDATSFPNYLFVYDHSNHSGHEAWDYDHHNSLGFSYDKDTTCNELKMEDLAPGVYYVNIDPYNYFFDEGKYTIKMTCSDNDAVVTASGFNEYKPPFPWWAIFLIVVGSLILIAAIIACIYFKKKSQNGGDDAGTTDSPAEQEMVASPSDKPGTDGGDTHVE